MRAGHKSGSVFAARRLIAPALLALLLASCAEFGRIGTTQVSLPEPPKQSDTVQPGQREHNRILAAYGGA